MGFLQTLTNLFTRQPYQLNATVSPYGIKVGVNRGEKTIPHKELLTQKKILPSAFWDFINKYGKKDDDTYYGVSLPDAQTLSKGLTGFDSEYFKIDLSAVDSLQVVLCPPDFSIYWRLDSSSQFLNRNLAGTDGYLGGGWFYRGKTIWQLDIPLQPAMQLWLSKSKIAGAEFYEFLTDGLETHRSIYFRCELSIESNFTARIHFTNMRRQSVNVQVTCNMPELKAALMPIENDKKHLLSGTHLIPNWHTHLPGRLLHLARSAQTTRFIGNDLLELIKDDLESNADILGTDMAALKAAYPIYDAVSLPQKWNLVSSATGEIGAYKAVPCLVLRDELLPIEKFEYSIEKGERFYQTNAGWLEFTPLFKERYADWKHRNLRTLDILPQEIIGSSADRLNKLGLRPPKIEIPPAVTEVEQARLLIQTMKQHGLPVGLYGLQTEMPAILTETCARVLNANKRARILWIVPKRKHDALVRALKSANIPLVERQDKLDGRVLLLTPDNTSAFSANIEWSLLIFSDLDILASVEKQSRVYQALRRLWTISTFSRADWDKNAQHTRHTLRALRMSGEDLKSFRQHCMGTYSDQSQSIISRITSPFKKIFATETAETKTTGGVAIPPRQPTTSVSIPPRPTPAPLSKTEDVYRPTFTVTVSSTSTSNSFLSQAKKLVNHTERQTDPVPFMQYWATYSSMTSAQKKWYFYWRSQVRQQNYLAADLSYLFIHIYEVIHLVGFEQAQEAFDYLENFWRQYRTLHPKLDRYLIDWLADFQIVYKLADSGLGWYARVQEQGDRLGDLDTALEVWLSTSAEIHKIPASLLGMLSDYDYARSKFFLEHNANGSVENDLRRGLSIIDTYVQQKEGKSFFDRYRPARKQALKRTPFASAVYEGKRAEITVANVSQWSQSSQLKVAMTGIIKYTENLLRRQRAFKGTLRGVDLAPEWAALLDAAFLPPIVESAPKKRRGKATEVVTETLVIDTPISIDFEKVKTLIDVSDEVRQRLTVNDGESGIEVTPMPAKEVVSVISDPSFNVERPADTPAHLLTELREVAAIITGDDTAIQLLHYLQGQQWESNEDAAQVNIGGAFLSVVLDRINALAIENIGDSLIFAEGKQLVVAEDYRDELEYLLKQTVEDIKVTAELKAVAPVEHYEHLTEEWAAFVHRMKPHHWEALNALILGEDVVGRLDGIARSVYITLDLLVDELNEFALESVGDIIIETGGTPRIEDEDFDNLRSLVEWALTSIQQE